MTYSKQQRKELKANIYNMENGESVRKIIYWLDSVDDDEEFRALVSQEMKRRKSTITELYAEFKIA